MSILLKEGTAVMVAVSLLVATALHVTPLPTQADIHWIGVSAPTTNVVWLSGSQATIARSTDGGTNWEYFKPTNDNLQFRDIEALDARSEEHTSELQSRPHLVCRLLLEKKKKKKNKKN